ncbi:MAG: lipid II:glycine glycyltransferase FemX [Microgenomates group bacterium]
MEIRKINSSLIWKKFFNQGNFSFLHSWEWGEFQKRMGNSILRLGLFEKNIPLILVLIIKQKIKRGKFLFIPHGPIFLNDFSSLKKPLVFLLKKIKKIAIKNNFWFIRIAPWQEDNLKVKEFYQELGFRQAPIYMHAEKMWVLNLNKNEEELLKEMRKTTRYLIRKALKSELKVEKREDLVGLEIFWKLYLETAKREKFVPFSFEYLKKEFEVFKKTNSCQWFLVSLQGKYLAGALIIFTKKGAFYHQGASIHTSYPASYLLQWEAIKEAKKRGCQTYNFWGIYQEKRTPKSWQGLTLFKTGFGGREFTLLPTQDLIISPFYWFTYGVEKWLNFKRGV